MTTGKDLFVVKAFMLPHIEEKFNLWFDANMVYCESTCGFVHRCYDEFKNCSNYREAQNAAFKILNDMRAEFLVRNYDIKSLKEAVKKIKYEPPFERWMKNRRQENNKCRLK